MGAAAEAGQGERREDDRCSSGSASSRSAWPISAGAVIGREPAGTFWGGYSGVFIDPDGHPWEVAHNPGWTLRSDGTIGLSE